MNPYLAPAGLVGGGAARSGGLFDLLKPLDYPRQALANLVKAGTGNGSLLGALPGLLGAGAGLMTGGPLGGLLAGGLAQGLGLASGEEDFNAPTTGDVAGSLGLDPDSMLSTGLVGALTDPLSYATLGIGRGAKAGEELALGVQEVHAANELELLKAQLASQASEAAALGQAEQQFVQAHGGLDSLLSQRYPAPPVPGLNGGGSLADIGAAATDPRLPFVGYAPKTQAALPEWPSLGAGRVSGRNAGDVLDVLNNSGVAAGSGVAPGGRVSFLANPGELPPGLASGRGGWLSASGDIPGPPISPLEVGATPPGLALPPGAGRPDLPSMAGLLTGQFPEGQSLLPQLGMQSGDVYNLRRMLAGIGQEGTSVMDLPLDAASSLLGQEASGARGQLQQLLARIQQLPPDQQRKWAQLFPGSPLGAAPAVPSIGAQQLGLVNYGVR